MIVRKISYQETRPWILEKHYAKRMPSISFAFGLFDDDTLYGIVSYGSPASAPLCKGVCGVAFRKDVLELNRLVINSNAPKNSASMLVGRSLKLLPKDKCIVSYADSGMGHIGYVYQATNWLFTGTSKPRTDIFAGNGKHARHHKGDKSIRQLRTAKHRYIYFTGKNIRKELNYPILPYPKGVTERYECKDINPSRIKK